MRASYIDCSNVLDWLDRAGRVELTLWVDASGPLCQFEQVWVCVCVFVFSDTLCLLVSWKRALGSQEPQQVSCCCPPASWDPSCPFRSLNTKLTLEIAWHTHKHVHISCCIHQSDSQDNTIDRFFKRLLNCSPSSNPSSYLWHHCYTMTSLCGCTGQILAAVCLGQMVSPVFTPASN